MKLFLKKYAFDVLCALILYTLIYATALLICRGVYLSFFNPMLPVTLLNSLILRLTDDISDYENDVKRGKAVFLQKTLVLLTAVCVLISLALSIFCKFALNALTVFLIFAAQFNLFQKKYNFSVIKIMILPLMAMYASPVKLLSVFGIMLTVLFFAIGLIFYIYKVKRT